MSLFFPFFFFFLSVNNSRVSYDLFNSVLICQLQGAPSINIELPLVPSFAVYLVQLMPRAHQLHN